MTESPRARRRLLLTDLDRTLLPNGAQPESPEARTWFARLAALPEVVVVYVTGRDRARVERAISSFSLPEPALVAADVGTTMFEVRRGHWSEVGEWTARFETSWTPSVRKQLAGILEGLPALRRQELDRQTRFKQSFYFPLHLDAVTIGRDLEERLAGLPATAVVSIDEPASVGLVDVVPADATKLHAVRFVRERYAVAEADSLFAGDSGNDVDVLASETPAVVVANAAAAVVGSARRGAADNGYADRLLVAAGGAFGMNGHYAAGIIEGVLHFWPDVARRLVESPG